VGPAYNIQCFVMFWVIIFGYWVCGRGYLFNQVLNKLQRLCMRRGYYKVPSEPIIPEMPCFIAIIVRVGNI